jgi:hypothetical protein
VNPDESKLVGLVGVCSIARDGDRTCSGEWAAVICATASCSVIGAVSALLPAKIVILFAVDVTKVKCI